MMGTIARDIDLEDPRRTWAASWLKKATKTNDVAEQDYYCYRIGPGHDQKKGLRT